MNLVVKQFRAALAEPPEVVLTHPVVRIQARFGSTWAAWGSGFLIGQWPSSIITARHVVALPQVVAPADVRVEAHFDGAWSYIDVAAVAYPANGPGSADVAIVRIQAACVSSLQAATMDGPTPAEVWGYPLQVRRSVTNPLRVGCRAQPVYGQITLDRPGQPGMSGGPVVAVSDGEQPSAVVGIYLGLTSRGARAQPLIDDTLFACKDAAMNIMTSPVDTNS